MHVTMEQIQHYMQSPRFREALEIPEGAQLNVSPLGQGEYNMNYQFSHPVSGRRLVFRINTGSQMHLEDQIGYEYRALRFLQCSGRTPHVYYVDGSRQLLDQGILVMEFLPGRPLDYHTDLTLAANCLADIHGVPGADCGLICPADPLGAILQECREMAQVYLDADQGASRTKALLTRFLEAGARWDREAPELSRCIINTELNAGNFLINGPGRGNYLIDWEKPLLGEAAQDLGHFLAPTTTLWKTEVLLTGEEKQAFLSHYHRRRPETPMEQLSRRTAQYEAMTCLRGITWCAMAWIEYQDPGRPIQNEATYRKICTYLGDDFLGWLWDHYFA